ncbi:MAG: hypothetical protein RLZ16_196 [Bacteroidota bacterium]|jgi:hypothetical protein
MVQAYNFLASWQLFPEKCIFEYQIVPKSGNYKIETVQNGHLLSFSHNWVSIENEAFYAQYQVNPNGEIFDFENKELAEEVSAEINNASCLTVQFIKSGTTSLKVTHEILANGFLKVTHQGNKENGDPFTNVEVYHKQLSVLPYASSAGSVAIRPTKEGVIKHKALSAMEDQTNMQLNQIREQIELLARQAQEIRKRKELSLMIYEAKITFKPQIGQVYHVYEKADGSHVLSLVAPSEWGGGSGPFAGFIATVKLLADHTWVEV